MPKGIMIVESAPASSDREDDFNKWYDETHLPQILAISGASVGRRFRRIGEGRYPYIAIFEIEADDLEMTLSALGRALQSGELEISPALGLDPAPTVTVYELLNERSA